MSHHTVRRLRQLGGAARLRDLGRVAGSRAALRSSVASGLVRRTGRGVYALADAPPAIVAAATHGAIVSCISAVAHSGIAVLAHPDRPHVSIPANRGRIGSATRDDCLAVVHREAWVREVAAEGAPVAPLDVALARMLICCTAQAALVSIDSALNQGRVTAAQIAAAIPVTADVAARLVLARADGRSMSPIETIVRLALRSAGFAVEAGVLVERVGFVDLVVGGRVVVELDGYEFHRSRAQFEEDRRRDRELVAQGFIVLRFTWSDVTFRLDRLVASVTIACARVGVRPERAALVERVRT